MIRRQPDSAAQKRYDLIVIGGGIYGAMLALEASLRECSVLLLEKEDFGGATSYNSLKIIHGGLRDLQTLDLIRYWTFGRERRWFLQHFPELVKLLPVLVPLYERGLMRTSIFRFAFLVDRLLLPDRDQALPDGGTLPYGEVISPSAVKRLFPDVDERGLAGGGLWYDACVPDPQRLLVNVLRAACRMGAAALNYVTATDLMVHGNRVKGVRARDTRDGTRYDFVAEVVINAAGPWSRELARAFDRDISELFPPSIAWNILFDRKAPSECALGVRPPVAEGQRYFIHPWKGRLLVGTGHAAREDSEDRPEPTDDEIDHFIRNLNRTVPGLELDREDILHVYAGYLPVRKNHTTKLAREDACIDHWDYGGPRGLYSVRSTKFTAARATAERVMTRIFPDREVSERAGRAFLQAQSEQSNARGIFDYDWHPAAGDESWREDVVRIIEEESVVHLDDLILRRTSLGDNPVRALELAPELCSLFDWDEDRRRDEVARVERHFRWVSTAGANDAPSRRLATKDAVEERYPPH